MRKKRHHTSAMQLLCALLGLVLGMLLMLSCAFRCLLPPVSSSPQLRDSSIVPVFTPAASAGYTAISLSPKVSNAGSTNILLIGQDRREGETQSRSDSIILCTFSGQTSQLTVTSFLRDLYVPIPGRRANRINAAYSFGGRELLKQTLEENFGITIDGCVEFDFLQFSGIIDTLGGVTLPLRQDEAKIINQETGSTLGEGTHTLTGDQALAYARIRKLDPDGDFSRTDRQRKVMQALVDSYRKASPARLIPLLKQLLPMLSTDLSQKQLFSLAMEIIPELPDLRIVSQRIPADGTFADKTIDGMQVLAADLEAAKKLLQDING